VYDNPNRFSKSIVQFVMLFLIMIAFFIICIDFSFNESASREQVVYQLINLNPLHMKNLNIFSLY
jgi:hypothetical protein